MGVHGIADHSTEVHTHLESFLEISYGTVGRTSKGHLHGIEVTYGAWHSRCMYRSFPTRRSNDFTVMRRREGGVLGR